MEFLKVADAAARMGIKPMQVHRMIQYGTLRSRTTGGATEVRAKDVESARQTSYREAAGRVGDPVAYARTIRGLIWPADPVGRLSADQVTHLISLPRGREALRDLPPDAGRVFGRHLLAWVAMRPEQRGGACGFCWADQAARVHGDAPRTFGTKAEQALTGQRPCGDCTARAKSEMARTAQRIEAGRRRTESAALTAAAAEIAADEATARDLLGEAFRLQTAAGHRRGRVAMTGRAVSREEAAKDRLKGRI